MSHNDLFRTMGFILVVVGLLADALLVIYEDRYLDEQ